MPDRPRKSWPAPDGPAPKGSAIPPQSITPTPFSPEPAILPMAGKDLRDLSGRTPLQTSPCMAEVVGFEPTVPCGTTVFKTAAFDHSATPPHAPKFICPTPLVKIIDPQGLGTMNSPRKANSTAPTRRSQPPMRSRPVAPSTARRYSCLLNAPPFLSPAAPHGSKSWSLLKGRCDLVD